MKLVRRINRNIRDAFKSVVRNFSLSIASISCITITLVVVALSMVISNNVENFTDSIRKDVTVVVFLKSTTTEDQIKQIEKSITDNGNIEKIDFKSKEDTANELKGKYDIFGPLFEQWGTDGNPLLDSLMIKVENIEKVKDTANYIKTLDGIDSVSYGEEIVDQLVIVFKVVEKACVWAVVALVLVTAFLITNTIKLTIHSRRTEIEIMRLVGASNISIKTPFIIEGLFLGVLGSIVPICITIYGYVALYDFFGGKMFNSSLAKLVSPYPFVYSTSILLVVIGIAVGMIGSYQAVRKHLKI